MSAQSIQQMGSAKVTIGTHNGQACIVKHNANRVEVNFYQQCASQLDQIINVPLLYAWSNNTLTLEYIPQKILLSELSKRADTYQQLSRLHNSNLSENQLYHPHSWCVMHNSLFLEAILTL